MVLLSPGLVFRLSSLHVRSQRPVLLSLGMESSAGWRRLMLLVRDRGFPFLLPLTADCGLCRAPACGLSLDGCSSLA